MMTMKIKSVKSFLLLVSAILTMFVTTIISNASEPTGLAPAGSHSVNLQTGGFNFTFPIEVVPGRNGMQPNINLAYNSQTDNGWCGIGWDLSFGGFISRISKNGIPSYDIEKDTFIISLGGANGELVYTGSETGYRKYSCQIENGGFYRIRYYTSDSAWIVTAKNGTQYHLVPLILNDGKYYYWGVDKITDTNGNYLTMSYSPVNGSVRTVPTEILYTGNENTPALSPLNKIEFEYEVRSDTITNYRSGFKYQISQRLKTINVKSNNSLVRKYTLTYDDSEANISRLTAITQYGSDGLTSLPATTFSYYSTRTLDYGTDSNYIPDVYFTYYKYSTSAKYSINRGFFIGDVNGDGLNDIVQNWEGSVDESCAKINTGSGWSSNSSWVPPVRINYSVTDSQNLISIDEGVRFIDFDGDGLVDILQAQDAEKKDSNIQQQYEKFLVWKNTGSGWTPYTGVTIPYEASFVHRSRDSRSLDCGVEFADVNGDGLTDIIKYSEHKHGDNSDGDHTGTNAVRQVWLNNGSSWIATPIWVPPVTIAYYYDNAGSSDHSIDYGVRFIDLNGDGLADILKGYRDSETATPVLEAWINTGSGWINDNNWAPPVYFVQKESALYGASCIDEGVRFVDINNDGLIDIVQNLDSTTPSEIKKGSWLNTGNGWKRDDSYVPNVSFAWKGFKNLTKDTGARLVDLNGDGFTDIIKSCDSNNTIYISSTAEVYGKKRYFPPHAPPNPDLPVPVPVQPNVVKAVANSLSGTLQIAYYSYVQKDSNLPFSVHVVSGITTNDGFDNVIKNYYSFSGGKYDRAPYNRREFLGFSQAKIKDAVGNYRVSKFKQNEEAVNDVNIYKGRMFERSSYDASNNLLTKSSSTYTYAQPQAGVYFVKQVQTDNYLDSKHTQAKYEYNDTSGNITLIDNLGDTTNSTDNKSTVINYYSFDASKYILSAPSYKEVRDYSSAKKAATTYGYDTLGNLTSIENWNNNGANPVITFGYNSYGNLTWQKDANENSSAGTGNVISITYDSVVHSFPVSVSNSAAHTQGCTYDYGTGNILTYTDENNQTTTNTYDTFGRILKIVNPNDTDLLPSAIYEYTINSQAPACIKVSQRIKSGEAETLDSYNFVDGLGRTCQTKTAFTNGKQIVSGAVSYNSRGMVEKQYIPFRVNASADYISSDVYSSKPYTKTEYDSLARVVQITNPDSTYSTINYSGWDETVVDENNVYKDYIKDAFGQITEVHEHNENDEYITHYEYDILGNLKKVKNALDAETIISYDSLGRKTGLTNLETGANTYTYDANSNLKTQTDNKQQTITLNYDRLSRVSSKVYPDSTGVSYNYDNGDYAKGRLSSVSDLSGSSTFTYDKLGRVINQAQTVTGFSQKATSVAYDDLNRPASLTYPDNEEVDYNYDFAVLKEVTNPNSGLIYASISCNNDYGMVSNIKYGISGTYPSGSVSTDFTYKSNNLLLNTIKTNNSSLQDFTYNYNNIGNITSITDAATGTNQTFTYDDLGRLKRAVGHYGTKDYNYDKVGVIDAPAETTASGPKKLTILSCGWSANNVGTNVKATYAGAENFSGTGTSSSGKKIQLGCASIYDNPNNVINGIEYDNNGNIIRYHSKYLQYDFENRLKRVVLQDGSEERYSYDFTGQRVLTRRLSTTGTETGKTLYLGGGIYEETGSNITKNIYADGKQVAVKQNSDTYFVLQDNLGSTHRLTDTNGTAVRTIKYSPFGKSVSDQGSQTNIRCPLYTNQVLDSNTGIYYYNGRFYAPDIQRFTSNDPFVSEPYLPQNLNRYAYCFNSPSNFVDPSGYEASYTDLGFTSYETPASVYYGDKMYYNRIYNSDYKSTWQPNSPNIPESSPFMEMPSISPNLGMTNSIADIFPAMPTTGNGVSRSFSTGSNFQTTHNVLAGVGLVFDPADAVDAGLYAFEGDYENAAWSSLCVAPVIGSVATAGKGIKGTVVIGETMDRVKTAAKMYDAKWYQAWKMSPYNLDLALKRNERWIKGVMKKGYEILDIGINKNIKARRPAYMLEKRLTKDYPLLQKINFK